jgi:nucleolar protein 16
MQKIDANYESSGLVLDATARFGRNSRRDAIQQMAEARGAEGDGDGPAAEGPLDDDLVAAMAQVRSSGKAAPKRPTQRQRQIVQRLLEAHGQDVGAMSRDRRLNPMQHSRGVLEGMIAACEHWKEDGGVDFRVPTKKLA